MNAKKESQKQKIHWCQCCDVNEQLTRKIRGNPVYIKNTGKVCSKCGYNIVEELEEIIKK